jgi:hypothetical protein
MRFWVYRNVIATIILIWGILNVLSGDPLNVAKGLCGIALGLFIALAKTDERITRIL